MLLFYFVKRGDRRTQDPTDSCVITEVEKFSRAEYSQDPWLHQGKK